MRLTAIATDNIGNASVSPGRGIFVDTIAPTANSASVNSNSTSIVVTVSEELMLTLFEPDPPTGVPTFTLTDINGQPITDTSSQLVSVSAFSTVGNTLTLTTNLPIQLHDTVMLGWSAENGVIIEDGVGNPMRDFTGLPITVIDTRIPPTLNFDPVTGDDIINLAERTAGVTLTGTRVTDAMVTLCLRYSSDACTADAERTFFSGDTPTTWRYTLTDDDYTLMDEGEVTLRILGENKIITVDITPPGVPTITTPIATDNIVNGFEYDGFSVTGTEDDAADTTITLCSNPTDATDPTCAGGTIKRVSQFTVGNRWSAALNRDDVDALGYGTVTLTAIATDAVGNAAVSIGYVILVAVPDDTRAPTAESAAANAAGTRIFVTLSEPVILTNLETLNGNEFLLGGSAAARVTAVSVTDATLTLSVSPAIQPGERVILTWIAGNGDIIADASGNVMRDFANLLVVTSTTVVTGFSAEDGSYKADDSVLITITFSDVVTVTGTPQLSLATGNSAGNGLASYTGGSGTTSLTFTYLVRDGDNADDLTYTDIDALSGDIRAPSPSI